VWWTLYLACHLTGGRGSAGADAKALRNRALDVDLLRIVAAIGAVAIGQIFDGALLIVIFATSGALDDIATKHKSPGARRRRRRQRRPAMAAVRTSIAMGAGADLTPQTAAGVTVRDEPHTIPTLIG